VRYLPDPANPAAREARFEWRVFSPPPEPGGGASSVPGADRLTAEDPYRRLLGIDAKAEMQRRVRKLLFAPEAVAAQRRMTDLGARAPEAAKQFHDLMTSAGSAAAGALVRQLGAAPRPRGSGAAAGAAPRPAPGSAADAEALAAAALLDGVDLAANSIMPDVIKQFGKVTSPKGEFGYIRIVTFAIPGPEIETFIREFIRIAALLPQDSKHRRKDSTGTDADRTDLELIGLPFV